MVKLLLKTNQWKIEILEIFAFLLKSLFVVINKKFSTTTVNINILINLNTSRKSINVINNIDVIS